MHDAASILPVILAGGEGRRLAPIAAPERPKPFIPLPDGKSLFTLTGERLAFAPPLIVGQEAHRFSLLNHARDAGVIPAAVLLEPRPHNTAMAVAVATAWAVAHRPEMTLAMLPADHLITPAGVWQNAIHHAAASAAAQKRICLLAVPPSRADAQYGYMALKTRGGFFDVERFVEKPENPEKLLTENHGNLRWAWNAGQFIAPATVFAEALRTHVPELWAAAEAAVARSRPAWEFTLLEPSAYVGLGTLPFDCAVLEKAPAIAHLLEATWQDLGSISAWEEHTQRTADSYRAQILRTDRPWGYFELVSQATRAVEKRLTIYPGCRLSLQRHWLRSEAWEVLAGTAHVELNQQPVILQTGDKITIPESCWHRLSNRDNKLLIIKEIWSGFSDENDIERVDDDYGRL